MTRDQITERVIPIIADLANRATGEITEGQRLDEELYLDSIDNLEMQVSIEDEFLIELSDVSWQRCLTVKDVIDMVEEECEKP